MKNIVPGLDAIFVYRAVYQNSLQSTVDSAPSKRPLVIPRTGTSAPIGVPTLVKRTIPQEK